jgi:hypothetical protein
MCQAARGMVADVPESELEATLELLEISPFLI